MKDTEKNTLNHIIFGGKKLDKCLNCGGSKLVETDEKGKYACSNCKVEFYGDDYEGARII